MHNYMSHWRFGKTPEKGKLRDFISLSAEGLQHVYLSVGYARHQAEETHQMKGIGEAPPGSP